MKSVAGAEADGAAHVVAGTAAAWALLGHIGLGLVSSRLGATTKSARQGRGMRHEPRLTANWRRHWIAAIKGAAQTPAPAVSASTSSRCQLNSQPHYQTRIIPS